MFISDTDWSTVHATVAQADEGTHVEVRGSGDLDAAAGQVCRFLALDIDARDWPEVGQRDPVVGEAQRERLIQEHGDDGAFPAPQVLKSLPLDLPGRKTEYLHAVAEAALEGRLEAQLLRSIDPGEAMSRVQEIKGLGPFAAELVVIRGANAPDALPTAERRLSAEIEHLYGEGTALADVAGAWRPFRTWGSVYLRALRERRTNEIKG